MVDDLKLLQFPVAVTFLSFGFAIHIYVFQFCLNLTAVADSIGIPMTDDMAVRELAEQATFRVRTLLQTGLVNNAITTHPCT